MFIKSRFILLILFMTGFTAAQTNNDNRIEFVLDGVTFISEYDTLNFCSNFIVTASDKSILRSEECIERITSINAEDLDGDGKKEILIEKFSGGAHCCTSLYLGRITKGKFQYIDSVYFGNCSYMLEDLNKDGKREIISCNDMFAYFFTNYAQSRFPVLIYALKKGVLKLVNEEFKSFVNKDINALKEELKPYLSAGFGCPKTENEDTFNTDAGAVKAILAAITANYFYIGETSKGYKYIEKVYSCPDKKKFIGALKNEFKIK